MTYPRYQNWGPIQTEGHRWLSDPCSSHTYFPFHLYAGSTSAVTHYRQTTCLRYCYAAPSSGPLGRGKRLLSLGLLPFPLSILDFILPELLYLLHSQHCICLRPTPGQTQTVGDALMLGNSFAKEERREGTNIYRWPVCQALKQTLCIFCFWEMMLCKNIKVGKYNIFHVDFCFPDVGSA